MLVEMEEFLNMSKIKFVSFLLALTAFVTYTFAQTVSQNRAATNPKSPSVSQFFPLSELKEGMRGTAWTVFRGTEPEEFSVEILGIVPGAVGPGQDMIVGRISGGSADRTSVFAGMSGSPVYIDGKLVGSISYSFPFSKEPICGITPIAQMIRIFEQNQDSKPKAQQPRSFSFSELAGTNYTTNLPKNAAVSTSVLSVAGSGSPLAAVAGQAFQPIGTPVTFSGFSQATLNYFAPQLLENGLLPVAAAGGASSLSPLKSADDETLRGGASVTMHLTRGDVSIAASGTVTYRDGDKVYAFGHPFLSLGTADLPMSESHVVTVVPSVNNSFKLAVPDALVGTMTQDRNTGVFGKLGQSPQMIPVKLNLETSRNRQETFSFEIAKDDFLTPLLLNMAIYNTISANERGMGDSLIEIDGEIKIKNQDSIKIGNRFSGGQAGQMAGLSVASPVSAILKSRFDNAEIKEISLTIKSTDGDQSANLERIALDKTQVRPGETVEIQATVSNNAGKVFVQRIPFQIPADTPAGIFSLSIGDGGAIQQNAAIQQFVPKNLGELIKTVNDLKKSDRLYVQLSRTTGGAIIGASEMPNLPPSMMATLNNNRTAGGFKPTVESVIALNEIAPAEFVISGKQTLSLEILK